MTPCPPPDRLLGFASGELSDDQSASIEAHIDGCIECRGVLSNMARGDVPPSFGRYRLDTVLGSGGMGIVYRAYDPQLARAVAIKVVKRAAEDTTGRARLIREAQALARLSHPNVCHVYDVGTQDDEVWVAMELIDGVSLRQWAGDDLLGVLLGAAEGIHAAHEAGLVHRDIKPENVLVTRDGRAIVTDFGLARGEDKIDPNASTLSTDPHLTATGAIAGTPAYLAPEQLTGDPIDGRVDQFAWAVMAWELLTGSRPFPIIFALRVDAVRAGLTPPPTLVKPVAAALSRAMSVAPRDRFATMRELVDAIRGPAEPVRARRPRAPAIAGVGVLVAAAAGTAIWKWPAGHAARVSEPGAGDAHTIPMIASAGSGAPIANAPTAGSDAAGSGMAAAAGSGALITKTPAAGSPIAAGSGAAKPPKTVARDRTKSGKPITAKVPDTAALPNTASLQAQPQSQPAMSGSPAPVFGHKLRRANAIATMDAFCHIPYDPAHPDPSLAKPIVDWGRVVKVGPEAGVFNEDPLTENVVTLSGARGTYRFGSDLGVLGDVQPAVGDILAVCADREASNLFHLSGGPTIPMMSVVPMSTPPLITEVADLKPLHIADITFAAAGSSGQTRLASNRRYIVHALVGSDDGGGRWKMDRYVMTASPGIRGGNLIQAGARLWIVVEDPHFEDTGGKKEFTVRAVAVLGDMFPL